MVGVKSRLSRLLVPILCCCCLSAKESRNSRDPCIAEFSRSEIPFGVDLNLALDDFRGIYSGSWPNSFGSYLATNITVPFRCNFSFQIAGSYGLYEWSGRASTPFKNSNSLEQQGFTTVALSYLTPFKSGVNIGVCYDWMFNANFGLFAVDPLFDQIRWQMGYKFQCHNELGIWGTYGIQTSHKESQNVPLDFRGISQLSAFWVHYLQNYGYTMVWVGAPYLDGLRYPSRASGNLIFGVEFSTPITESFSFYGYGSYMWPRGWSGITPSRNSGANICFGLNYAFGKRRVQKTPYMRPANNTNFMADTNQNF